VLRVERDRQGAVKVFAGPKLTAAPAPIAEATMVVDASGSDAEPADDDNAGNVAPEPVAELPIIEAETVAPARRRKATKAKTAARPKAKATKTRARKSVRAKDVAADSE
jgi:hypothetical protein